MVDEIFDRDYQAARKEFDASVSGLLGKFGRAVGNAFRVLVRIEYQEPWKSSSHSGLL